MKTTSKKTRTKKSKAKKMTFKKAISLKIILDCIMVLALITAVASIHRTKTTPVTAVGAATSAMAGMKTAGHPLMPKLAANGISKAHHN